MTAKEVRKLTRDLVIVFFSVILAIILVRTGIIEDLVDRSRDFEYLTEFFAGILFTSTFTTPLAIANFIVLAEEGFDPLLTALIAGIGSVIGDYLIYKFVKDDLGDDLRVMGKSLRRTYIGKLFKSRLFYWLTPFIAGLIIMSPFPDELGVSMLGAIKIDPRVFVLISYSLNTLGIILIMFLGKSL